MKVLCPQCERLIALEQFRLDGSALIITCTRCQAQTRVEAARVMESAVAAPAPLPSRPVSAPPRVSLASTEGGSNVVVLRTAGHEAVQKAALAADEGPFAIPEGVCPKCIAKRGETPSCAHCGIHFENVDEAMLLPPKWLRDDWVELLRDWGNDTKHGHLRRKAQQAESLAALGRLYRLRQAVVPEDPVAELGRSEVLRMAAVAISFRPASGDEGDQRRKVILIGSFVVLTALLGFMVVQLFRSMH